MKSRRLFRSWAGTPLYLISGLAIFLILSILYDLAVGGKEAVRMGFLYASIGILAISLITKSLRISTLRKIFVKQMGN